MMWGRPPESRVLQRVLECTCSLNEAFRRALQTMGRETQNIGVS